MSKINRSVLSLEVPTISSFSTGGVVRSKTDAFIHDSGMYYWDGDLPHTVHPESEPTTIGTGSWVLVSDFGLRKELTSGDGSLVGVGGGVTLKDVAQSNKSVLQYGVKGDGSDESAALQEAINSGVVNVPNGMVVRVKSVTIPSGTHVNLNNTGTIMLDAYNSIKFQEDEKWNVLPANASSKTIKLANDKKIPEKTRWVKIHRPFTQTDDWYIDNSEDASVLGYTAEVFFVTSINSNEITLSSPIGFELYNDSYLTLIESPRTSFTGGIIKSNVDNSPNNTSIFTKTVSNIDFNNVEFDFDNHGGIRFNAAHSVNFIECVFKNSGYGNVNYSYGCTDCNVSQSISYGSFMNDAAISCFAGCRRVYSVNNKFYLEKSSLSLGGFYIGAKCIGCKSISDTFIGGRYGVMAMFGAQQFEMVSPYCRGQSDAGVFVERCQYFKVIEPNIDLDHSSRSDSDPTFGSVVMKDCDNYLLHNDNRLCRNTKRMLSVYSFNFNKSKLRAGVHISLKGTGVVQLIVPTNEAIIDGVISDKHISYFQGGNLTNGLKIYNCDVSAITLYNFINSVISNNKIRGSETGILISGSTAKWNYFINNSFHGASLCYELTESNRFMNSIKGVNLFGGSSRVCNFPVKSSDQVAVGYQSSNPAPKGFKLYVTEHLNDGEVIRTKEAFRHTGYNRGTTQDWIGIGVSEGTL